MRDAVAIFEQKAAVLCPVPCEVHNVPSVEQGGLDLARRRFGQGVYVRNVARAFDAGLNPTTLLGNVEQSDGVSACVYQRMAAYRQNAQRTLVGHEPLFPLDEDKRLRPRSAEIVIVTRARLLCARSVAASRLFC